LPCSPRCSPSTHGGKIKKNLKIKWTRDEKKKKIRRKKEKVGRQECLPLGESKSTQCKSVESKKRKKG
jgi:hypothetical protein